MSRRRGARQRLVRLPERGGWLVVRGGPISEYAEVNAAFLALDAERPGADLGDFFDLPEALEFLAQHIVSPPASAGRVAKLGWRDRAVIFEEIQRAHPQTRRDLQVAARRRQRGMI